MLRHTVATLAYRGAKVLRGAPESFGAFRARETSRTPVEILAHISDLLDWAVTMADGEARWHATPPQDWDRESERFFAALQKLEDRLASPAPLQTPPEKIFQGPIADALTHVGQIAMLRRMAGAPVRGENYFVAEIATGRVGRSQPPARREFD